MDNREDRREDPEADGRGLLLVELLQLAGKFSWRRYREDLGGFLLAWGFVAALMLLLVGIARAEEIPAVDARFQVRGGMQELHIYNTGSAFKTEWARSACRAAKGHGVRANLGQQPPASDFLM